MEKNRFKLYDDAEWYFEKALANYIFDYQKSETSLTDEDYKIINEYAGNHIAYFITWIIKNKFESDFFAETLNVSESVEAVRNETMTGADFLFEHCDGKLDGEMLSAEILPFVDWFYEKYYFNQYYVDWVIRVLDDLPLEFQWSWEDYHSFEKVLNRRYEIYIEKQRSYKEWEEKRKRSAESK